MAVIFALLILIVVNNGMRGKHKPIFVVLYMGVFLAVQFVSLVWAFVLLLSLVVVRLAQKVDNSILFTIEISPSGRAAQSAARAQNVEKENLCQLPSL